MAIKVKISDSTSTTSSEIAASSTAVKSAYDLANGKAPKAHASTATTYGIGTGSNYGHVKLSDSTSSTSAASAGIAASPKAVKAAYDLANGKQDKLGYTPVKTVNGTSPNSAGNVALETVNNSIHAIAAYKLPYVTCSTSRYTVAKVGTLVNSVPFTLEQGAMIIIKFSEYDLTSQNSNATLNVNSTGAKPLYINNTQVNENYSFVANVWYCCVYDGSNWRLMLADLSAVSDGGN